MRYLLLACVLYLEIGGALWYQSFTRTMAAIRDREEKAGRQIILQPGTVLLSIGLFLLLWPLPLIRRYIKKHRKP